jgi:uncharacterized repeat protein (TIGR03803 family)
MTKLVGWQTGCLPLLVCAGMAVAAPAQIQYKTLHAYAGDWFQPTAGVTLDGSGNLYGTTNQGPIGGGVVFKLAPNSDGDWTESTLYTFPDSGYSDAGVIFDAGGSLFGTTYEGGAHASGMVFKLTPMPDGSWAENDLYSFCSLQNCVDGEAAAGGLIFDAVGNLYGTTVGGGAQGFGVAFRLTPEPGGKWTESVLHSFGNINDGYSPYSSLVFDSAGSLYGTTVSGGSAGLGVVFQLTPNQNGNWEENIIHDFAGGHDGAAPVAGLILDGAGNLYGTTTQGGYDNCGSYSCGMVFELVPNADGNWQEKILHYFTGGADGGYPYAGLTFDPSGNLYGTASFGGNTTCGCGVVFTLVPNSNGGWKEELLHTFFGRPGAYPLGTPVFDAAGDLYGTTAGSSVTGPSVFEIIP